MLRIHFNHNGYHKRPLPYKQNTIMKTKGKNTIDRKFTNLWSKCIEAYNWPSKVEGSIYQVTNVYTKGILIVLDTSLLEKHKNSHENEEYIQLINKWIKIKGPFRWKQIPATDSSN